MQAKRNWYIIKYIVFYVAVFCLVLLLLLTIRNRVKNVTLKALVSEEATRLQVNTDLFVSNISTYQAASSLIRKDACFDAVSKLKSVGFDNTTDLLSLQKRLQNLIIMCGDYLDGVYVVFGGNDVFVSNFTIGFDGSRIYPNLFKYGDKSYEEWGYYIRNTPQSVYFYAEQPVETCYFKNHSPMIMCIVRDSIVANHLAADAICFLIDANALTKRFTGTGNYEQYGLKICLKDGTVILERNIDNNVNIGDRYIVVENSNGSSWVNTYMYIPRNILLENVSVITRIIMLYVYVGILGLLAFAGLLVIKYLVRETNLIRLSRSYLDESVSSKRPIDYIGEALEKIKIARDDATKKAMIVQSTHLNDKLINACKYGFHLKNEESELKNVLGEIENGYVLILAESEEESVQVIEAKLVEKLSVNKISIYIDTNTIALIIAASDDKQAINSCADLIELDAYDECELNIGISLHHKGIDQLFDAYAQAQNVLWLRKLGEHKHSMFYDKDLKSIGEISISLSILCKMTETIITGEASELTSIFVDFKQRVADESLSETGFMYMFSAIRVAILNAAAAVDKDKTIAIPDFNAGEEIGEAISRLEQSAQQLCLLSCRKRLSNNTQLRQEIIQYIEEHLSEEDLCADSIADAFRLSRSYVLRFMQSQLNKPLPSYIDDRRVDSVENLLLNTDWTIEQIMAKTGFGSLTTLYRAFRRRHSMTPGAWREKYPADNEK